MSRRTQRILSMAAVFSMMALIVPGARAQLPPVDEPAAPPPPTYGDVQPLQVAPSYAPSNAPSNVTAPVNASRWPVSVSTAAGDITVFQPQLEDFQGDQLKARAAVSILQPGQTEPLFGTVWLTSRVSTDRVARTVAILDVQITQTRFAVNDPATVATLTDGVRQVFAGRNVTLSLDQLLAMVETVHQQDAAAAQLQNTPPRIIFLQHPAVKVQYDGTPRLARAANSNLLRVINTPFFVALDPDARTYFLKGGAQWFAAPDPLGPFNAISGAPPAVAALADASGYQDPQQPLTSTQAQNVEIVTATEPTELICTDGPEQLGIIPGTNLLYFANTTSDVFVPLDTQQLFVLLSGRWYTAPGHSGPWSYVPPGQLPADFSRIPPGSAKGDVLASVPGTQEAQDAIADTYVPQTASVNLHQFDQPPVVYDGEADFEPISGTNMSYAVNTDASVVQVGGRYYACYNAVWYDGPASNGPWQISTSVPPEIYTIPPSCPIYPVRFCYVYGHNADVAFVGYLPGYVGDYVHDGVVVYGTGYHYAPWIRSRYFPRPYTYGFAAHYNAYAGHWGFDFAVNVGGGRAWIGAAPGRWVHSGGGWFGYGGFRPVVARDTLHAGIAQREFVGDPARRDPYFRDVYDHRSDVHRDYAEVPRRDERGGVAVGVGIGGGDVGVGVTIGVGGRPDDRRVVESPDRGRRDDVFAGRDGNVYRRTDAGWEVRDQNQWKAAPEGRDTPRGEAPRADAPRADAPRANAPRAEAPPRDVPQRDDPRASSRGDQNRPQDRAPAGGRPSAPPTDSGLNSDYRARVNGSERSRSAPQAPPDARSDPKQAPAASAPRGGNGAGGGSGDSSAKDSPNNAAGGPGHNK